MKNQSKFKRIKARQVKTGLKLFAVGLIPLVTGLVLGRTFSLAHEISPAMEAVDNLRTYTVAWGPRSFDEAVWRAVEWIATVEETSPPKVAELQVEIRSSNDTYPSVSLAFDRIDLERLKAGELAPEVFIREHVEFH